MGAFLLARLRAVGGRTYTSDGVRVRALGGDRAGEMRITRFLRNRQVTPAEMVATAAQATAARVKGRHNLAIQDSTSLRDDGAGSSLVLHPTIAVNALDGAAGRPITDLFDAADRAAIAAVSNSLEGRTQRQKNPHRPGSLAFAAWVCARLGGWTGYYGKPGPLTILNGLLQLRAIQRGYRRARLL